MTQKQSKESTTPWYKEPWPWFLMAGPFIVIIAGFVTFYVAANTEDSLVTDDYYKEGKNIYLQIERDQKALDEKIKAWVYIQNDMERVMVVTRGDYDPKTPLLLLFIHPTFKKYDQEVDLEQSENDPHRYTAKLKFTLPDTNNWYVRLEDKNNEWKIESRWIVSQGNSVELLPYLQKKDKSSQS